MVTQGGHDVSLGRCCLGNVQSTNDEVRWMQGENGYAK